jgi:selenoprotein W-related protein
MAQELLSTFEEDIGELALIPGGGGVFCVTAKDRVVWDRAEEGGFPEITTLKQRVRDQVAPEKRLGHTDRRETRRG